MNQTQRVVKYFALALALFLILIIVFFAFNFLHGITSYLDFQNKEENEEVITELQTTFFDKEDTLVLDVDVRYAALQIVSGNIFQMQTNNTNITYTKENERLKIKEKSSKWFSNYEDSVLIISIPDEMQLEKVILTTGAGKVSVDRISTKNLEFELGAGEAEIRYLSISNQAEIESGAGKLEILDGIIQNLDLDIGVGQVILSSKLIGKNEINAGIGELVITLLGNKDDYWIKVNKGFGGVKIDNQSFSDGQQYGNGTNLVEIDGGIGNIEVKFE